MNVRPNKLLLILPCLLLLACAQKPVQPDSYVVLLENPDGTTGKVTFSDQQGQQTEIDKSGVGVRMEGASRQPFEVDKAKLDSDFGSAMSAQPKLPSTFLLYFEKGGTKLIPESEQLIQSVLKDVGNRPAPDVSIIGHTDTVGKAEVNEALALKRAQAIADKITAEGLKAIEITVTSHGERNLLIPTGDNVDEPKNRRVEITVR